MTIKLFFKKYFLDPIRMKTGYNVVNTVTYALIFVLAILAVHKLFHRLKIKLDDDFPKVMLPFVCLGALIRASVDIGILPYSYILVTPGIYFLLFFTVCPLFIGVYKISEKKNFSYKRILVIVGVIATAFFLLLIVPYIKNPVAFLTFLIPLPFMAILKLRFVEMRMKLERNGLLCIYAHTFDGSSTFIGSDLFGYVEQHVLPRFFANLLGTALFMIPLKFAVSLLVVYYVRKEVRDTSFKNLIYFAILTIGLAPGIRNTLRIATFS